MAGTSFSEVYDLAICRFKDYDWLRYSDEDREHLLKAYLMSTVKDVSIYLDGTLELAIDESSDAFTSTLGIDVLDILASGVAYYWYSAKQLNSELLKNVMSTKDFSFFSPANLMRELSGLRKQLWSEYRDSLVLYSYHHGDISSLSS